MIQEAAADPRRRAGETKRQRSRAAILLAAQALFEERGWTDTRVEAIASAAGLGTATVYKHFPTKNALAAAVYAPLVRDLVEAAVRDAGSDVAALDAIIDFLSDLTHRARLHHRLTVALLEAVHDAAIRHGQTITEDDPRAIVPLTHPLTVLIAAGQRRGELLPYPETKDAGPLMMNLLLLRILTRPGESADRTAELILTILRRTLCPPTTPPPAAPGPRG